MKHKLCGGDLVVNIGVGLYEEGSILLSLGKMSYAFSIRRGLSLE